MSEPAATRNVNTIAAAQRRLARPRGRGLEPLVPWLIAAIVISGLYFGRSVLIPIILAVLLSFLLTPIVAGLRRAKLPRPAAVLLAVMLSLGGAATTAGVIISQASTLSKDGPLYAKRVADKATNLRNDLEHRFGGLLRQTPEGGSGNRNAARARRAGTSALAVPQINGAIPVEVRDAPPTAFAEVQAYIVPALAPLETALIVLIITIFILFQKEDLRDRLLRLMGSGDLHRSTMALDEGGKRLSRYFLSQFVVNCGFGAMVWCALYLLGIPSPGLWGILAGLLRFVPYIGPVIAAVGPLALAAAIDPGWHLVIGVALLFVVLEPLVGYAVEPLLYGHSTGLSPVSVVIAALFWTWIWGPIGLVLSMPLTLVLVVLGRHVPAFEIFDVLLGDRPALSPAETFYQRALAGHPDEAIEQAEDQLESCTLTAYYDDVVLGGLRLAAADVDRGAVQRSALHSVCETTLEVLHAFSDYKDPAERTTPASSTNGSPALERIAESDLDGRTVLCVPGRGPLDPAVAAMMTQLLRHAGCEVIERSRDTMRRDSRATAMPEPADAMCILGLFDERAYRRVKPVVQLDAGAAVLIGVRRSAEPVLTNNGPHELLSSLSAMLEAVYLINSGRSEDNRQLSLTSEAVEA